jgi:beta-glucosidase
MARVRFPVALLVVATVAALVGFGGQGSRGPEGPSVTGLAAATSSCPWVDSSQPISRRVAQVMGKMSLADEITLVEGQGSSQAYVFYMAGIPRLCIPPMGLEDGPNGVGDGLKGVTQLPAGVDLAATWDPSLAYSYGRVVGAEQAGKGSAVDLGPTVNIDRDPRWGRSFETYTEDPALNASIAVNEINGIQSTGVMAQVKHFDAYNQETNRNTPDDNVLVSNRTLEEIYLPAFEAAVKQADVASVMCAYSTVNGEYSCQNTALLTGILRQQWDFGGFVTSDYGAIHSTTAATAGTDMEQPENTYFGNALAQAVRSGAVPKSVLNTMIQRILTEMFRFDLFRHPPSGSTTATVTTAAHVATSNTVAEDGTVLLKNSGALPLPAKGAGTVAVIGPSAAVSPTDGGGGSAAVVASSSETPLQGITAVAGTGTKVVYRQGLPTDTALPAVPAADLSPAYAPTPYGGTYTGTLTAPETGTYAFALTNPCGCYAAADLSVGGQALVADPGTPPVSTYSASVHLTAGQTYPVQITGATDGFTWGTPSSLAPDIASAVAVAKSASTAVVVVSDDTETEAADRPTLDLPSAQNELISAVAAANPHTVVVIDAGAPVVMPWLGQVSAVMDAWYPGQTNGDALAALLFGQVDPSGHLPVTFPTGLSQVPAASPARFPGVNGQVQYSEGIDVGYRWYEAEDRTPLFPFGFGLSYTSFRFSHLHVPNTVVGDADTTVTATVTNTGTRAGSDVAQLYLGDPPSTGEPPRVLTDFRRVVLAAGASTVVRFTLTPQERSWWDSARGGWNETPGAYDVYVGDSSALADLTQRGAFAVDNTPGPRLVTISAPSKAPRGAAFDVRVQLGASGNETLHDVRLALQIPAGWKLTGVGPSEWATVAPGSSPTATFRVTPPTWQPVSQGTLHATARFGDVVREGGAGVATT